MYDRSNTYKTDPPRSDHHPNETAYPRCPRQRSNLSEKRCDLNSENLRKTNRSRNDLKSDRSLSHRRDLQHRPHHRLRSIECNSDKLERCR